MTKLKGIISAALIALSLTATISAQEGKGMRFPQDKSYGKKVSGSKDAIANTIRNQYQTNYLRFWRDTTVGGESAGYVYAPDTDGYGTTTSEAHGFAMIITAIMGDETRFDKLASFYYNNIYIGNLMNWRMGSGNWEAGTATDGDLDMGYAFLLAEKQWPGNGYGEQANKIIADILNYDIDGAVVPSMGVNWNERAVTRPSDWMGSHFSAFNSGTWTGVKNACYSAYTTFMNNNSTTSNGLISDFVEGGYPSQKANEDGINDTYYYTNACRVPMRLAMDYATTGESRASSILSTMLGWLSTKTSNDASKIAGGYKLDGTALSSDAGLEYVAPFGAGLIAVDNQAFMDNIWTHIQQPWLHHYDNGDSATAYGEAIATLSMLVMSGNFWKPTDDDTYIYIPIDTTGVVLDHFGNAYGDDNAQAHLGACKGVSWGDSEYGIPNGDTTYHYGGSYWYGYAGKNATITDGSGGVIFDEGDNLNAPSDNIITDNKLNITFNLTGGDSLEYGYAGIGVSLASSIAKDGDSTKSTDQKADLSNLTAITVRYKSTGSLRMALETEKVSALAESSPEGAWISDFGWFLPASPDEFTQTEFKIADMKPETGGSILDSLINKSADSASWKWTADGNANKVAAFGITASEDVDKGATIKLEIEEIILVGMKYADFGINYREPTPIPITAVSKSVAKNNWTAFTNGNTAGIKFNSVSSANVEAALYNAAGKRIATASKNVKKGLSKVMFNNVNLSNGRYFVKVKADGRVSTSAFNFVK